MKGALIAILFMTSAPFLGAFGQAFNLADREILLLQDGTQVELVQRYDELHRYYYLPANICVSRKKDNTPEISFLAVREHEKGPIIKGILHFLLCWGLTREQLNEAENLLRTKDESALIMGAIPLRGRQELNLPLFYAPKGNSYVDHLNAYRQSSASVPTYPGGKWAASHYFPASAAKDIQEVLGNPAKWGDSTVRFSWYSEAHQREIYIEKKLKTLFNREILNNSIRP